MGARARVGVMVLALTGQPIPPEEKGRKGEREKRSEKEKEKEKGESPDNTQRATESPRHSPGTVPAQSPENRQKVPGCGFYLADGRSGTG